MNKQRELAEREVIYNQVVAREVPFPGIEEMVKERRKVELVRYLSKSETIFVIVVSRSNDRCEGWESEKSLVLWESRLNMSQNKAIEFAVDLMRIEDAELMNLEWAIDYDREGF